MSASDVAVKVVIDDLELLCDDLREEFGALSGRRPLIADGAGFLGYYIGRSALHWSCTRSVSNPNHVTVLDRFVCGTSARPSGFTEAFHASSWYWLRLPVR